MKRLLLLFVLLPLGLAAQPQRLQLVLCIGQSNMAGRGPLDAAARDTLPGVFLFNAEGRFEPAAGPLNRYSSVRKELGMQRVGPAGSFAVAFAAASQRELGVRYAAALFQLQSENQPVKTF